MLATGLTTPAAADTPVVVDQDALASHLFAGIVDARLDSGLNLVKAVTESAEFLEWRRLNPTASLADSKTYLSGQQQLLNTGLTAADQQLGTPDAMMRAIDVLTASSTSAALTASHIRALVQGIAGSSVGPLDNREDMSEGALLNLSWQRSRDDILSSLWTDVRHSALADPVFAQAWNAVVGAPASLDATASLDQLKAADELRGSLDIDKILALSGNPTAFKAEAQSQANDIIEGLLGLTDGVIVDAKIQIDICPVKTPPSPACTSDNQKTTDDKDKKAESAGDKLKAALTALDPVLKAVDPDLANDVKVVGGAVATIMSSISKYRDDIDKIAEFSGKVFSLATLTMTGNVVGAVLSLASLFGGSGPDNQTLTQIKALQTQVKNLGDTMKTRFDAVDKRLNNIYNTMVAEFNKLDAAIAGNTAQLVLLQQNVAQIGLRLEEVTASILTAIGQDELVDARSAIDRYIGYADQFGQPIPTFSPDYIGAESTFHLTGTQLAHDAAFVVPASDADDSAVDPTAVLNSNGETRSINYLAELASKRDPAIVTPTAPVGNAAVWDLGAQAYTLLALQNPGYAQQVASGRATDVAGEGQRILDLAASFAHPVTSPDSNGNYRNALFKSLDSDYRAAVASFSSAMAATRTNDVQMRYEPNSDGVQIKTLKNYNLFWDGTSALATAPPVPADPSTITYCDPGLDPTPAKGQISRPLTVSLSQLPDQVKLLDYAYAPNTTEPAVGAKQLPDVDICYLPSWVRTRITSNDTLVQQYGYLRLDVFTRYRLSPSATWQNVADNSYTWTNNEVLYDSQCVVANCHIVVTPQAHLVQIWTTDVLFNSDATRIVDSSVLNTATATVQQFLTSRQKFLYDSVSTALANPGTPTYTAVTKVNTAMRLLQAYTQLGLPIALSSDSLMSSLLLGQFKLIGNMPTEATIGNALQNASNNYSCGTSCTIDVLRPIRNQTFFDPTDTPCATSTAGPGDPLGNCLVEHALRRETNLTARLEVHFKQLTDGDYVEQLPTVARALDQLRIIDRLSHAAPVTEGIGNTHNDQGQTVSLDLGGHTTGGKAPYTFTATNLPPGLTLASSGVIQGTPTTNGTFSVTVTAHDAAGHAGNAYTFGWTIGVVDVPDLTGLSWTLAQAAIRGAGFTVGNLTAQTDCTVPEGTVQTQTPQKDTEVSTAAAPSTQVNVAYTVCPADSRPGLAPLSVANGQVNITWTDKSIQEDTFVLSRYTTGGQFVSQALSRPSGTKTGTGTVFTYTDATPDPNAPCYKIEAHEFGDTEVLASETQCIPFTVTNPGDQTVSAGNQVNLQIVATPDPGRTRSFTATGLPIGLTINSSTGLISGIPSRPTPDETALHFNVTVNVTDSAGFSANVSFTWNVNPGVPVLINPPWAVKAVADMNGDHTGDLVVYNTTTGATQIWFMNGSRVASQPTVVDEQGNAISIPAPWGIVGAADMNGDGKGDLVWYNSSTGETQIWFMNGNRIVTRGTVVDENGKFIPIGPPWSIVGAADMNHDGLGDLVWHNSSTGETQIWFMNGNRISWRGSVLDENGNLIGIGSPWSIVGATDISGDGLSDLVWYNSTNGATQIWYMNVNRIVLRPNVVDESGNVASFGSPWSIMGAADMNSDGKGDLVWHDSSTGKTQIWFMNGNRITTRATAW